MKTPVAVLGATGAIGQHLVARLQNHPWFEIVAVAASERSIGKRYGDLWCISHPLNHKTIADMKVSPCCPSLPCSLVFSALDPAIAGDIEEQFAQAGYSVISNSKNHRLRSDVPLLIPEINSESLALIEKQPYREGCIITNPNCVVIALALALKPLQKFGLKMVSVATLQAISGAGFNGLDPEKIHDNVIPFIEGEEEKIELELNKILGPTAVSAHCNRVPVPNGHLACLTVWFENQPSCKEILESWSCFRPLELPSSPPLVIRYIDEIPQPKYHLQPMEVIVGRIRPCSLGGWKFVILSNNQIRGAAGSALLNGELYHSKKNICLEII